MIGGFSVLMSGDTSLQGDTSLDDAVLEPPGDWIGWHEKSSVGMIRDSPVADEDFTMDFNDGDRAAGDEGMGE